MEEQFHAWVNAHHASIQRISRFYTFDKEEQKDLYQEILLQLWRSMPRFREQCQVGTWVYRIAVNTALMFRRSLGRRKERTGDFPAHEPSEGPSVERQMDEEAQLRWLYKAIGHLKDIDRTLVLLYLEDLSYQEMASVTGLSENHVGVRLHRIRQQLSHLANLQG